MRNLAVPFFIDLTKIGDSNLGYISCIEKENLLFLPRRAYWTYFTPDNVVRGGHAHYELEQILVAVAGRINVQLETLDRQEADFILESPNKGLFIPKMCWRTMNYSHNAVQLCLASAEYDEKDYIRDYQDFKRLQETSNSL